MPKGWASCNKKHFFLELVHTCSMTTFLLWNPESINKKALTSRELLIDSYIPVRKKKSITPVGIWTQVLLTPLFNHESTPQSITAWPIKIYRALTPPKSLTDLLNIWAWAWHTGNLIGKKTFLGQKQQKFFFLRGNQTFSWNAKIFLNWIFPRKVLENKHLKGLLGAQNTTFKIEFPIFSLKLSQSVSLSLTHPHTHMHTHPCTHS